MIPTKATLALLLSTGIGGAPRWYLYVFVVGVALFVYCDKVIDVLANLPGRKFALPTEVALRATPRSAGLAFTLRW